MVRVPGGCAGQRGPAGRGEGVRASLVLGQALTEWVWQRKICLFQWTEWGHLAEQMLL